MKRILILSTALLCVIIIAFAIVKYINLDIQIHNYLFKGESNDWIAVYKANSRGYYTEINNRLKYRGTDETSFNLTYKGDLDKLTAKKVEYKLSIGVGGSSSFSGPPPKRHIINSFSKGKELIIIPDDYIILTITIEGESPETIIMKK